MSATGYAYRHSLRKVSSRHDYVWISDELLSSTFRRFVNGQRRYETRVPGPLEARKRLAKRRNTALAASGTSIDSPLNVANLFGVNGSGHVRQWDDSAWFPRWPEPLELFSYSDRPPEPQIPSFLDHSGKPNTPQGAEAPTFQLSLERCSTVQDVKEALEWFQIDLRTDPDYSPLIFNHFCQLAFYRDSVAAIYDLIEFMNDQTLNVSGTGNYSALLAHLRVSDLRPTYKEMLVDLTARAIGLGLVPIAEVNQIIRYMPQIVQTRTNLSAFQQIEELGQLYSRIWESLRACNLFKVYEIYDDVLEPWVRNLLQLGDEQYLRLAKDIMIEYHSSMRSFANSASARALRLLTLRKEPIGMELLESWLDSLLVLDDDSSLYFAVETILAYHTTEKMLCAAVSSRLLGLLNSPWDLENQKRNVIEPIGSLLRQLDGDLATKYVVYVTEQLVFSTPDNAIRSHALTVWRHCLLYVNKRLEISLPVLSQLDESTYFAVSPGTRVALRIWIWSALSTTVHRVARPQRQPKHTDATIMHLLKLFDELTTSTMWKNHGNRTELLPKLIHGFQQLNLPCTYVSTKILALFTRKHIANASTLQAFRRLEEGEISLKEAALRRDTFNATKSYLLSSHLRHIEDLDVTDPDFIHDMLQAIEKDNRRIRDVIFLMSFHTPLKIALAMASIRSARVVPETKRLKSIMRMESKGKQIYLDPQACVAFVHLLASSIATSNKVSPRAAFNLLSYLYRYLALHNAPVKPSLVRAMYHCGITRFRENGLHVSRTQETYIMRLVKAFEEPGVVRGLLNGSYIVRV
ncbi:hypothetical protein BGW36DRAFT_421467 [Talaromyces proteolyticus]|uniref:Uncharacterized protein n=1 Tax=Talaromyces proteolyticus TaxID=1131652 RepID=A0AAD4L1I0_9EURO|nr:uncharacterized protein BGW36DRAFT_421467 [Talaromyces proteolyticus]KAH8704880.1 hypothetical protein BGW36DRAFT_421467 [Talaromyces proteolyticus]